MLTVLKRRVLRPCLRSSSSPGPWGFLLRTVTRIARPRILSTTRGCATHCPLPALVHTSSVRFSSPFRRPLAPGVQLVVDDPLGAAAHAPLDALGDVPGEIALRARPARRIANLRGDIRAADRYAALRPWTLEQPDCRGRPYRAARGRWELALDERSPGHLSFTKVGE